MSSLPDLLLETLLTPTDVGKALRVHPKTARRLKNFLTGMNPSEHWDDGWKVLSVGIELLGEKRPARHRIIPNVGTPVPPVGTKAGFAEAVERAALGITPRDARRSYARWLEEIGIPLYRRRAYMGHGPKSMTELYTWGDITAWLTEDTRTLARYVGAPMLRMEEA